MTSIIIPAHNEENVIERCLRPFVDVARSNEFEIIVVCNGCTDRTAHKVSELSESFICVETDVASKTNALNVGDEIARSYPRIYLDADILLPMETVSALREAIDSGFLAVAPEVNMDLSGSSWLVKAYYDVWLSLPYCKAGMMGAGVYALSERGRRRFTRFPEVIADDGYIRCLFKESERGITRGYYSVVNAPKNVASLIKIKTRSRLGHYQLKEMYPDIINDEEKDYGRILKGFIFDVRGWPKIFIYLVLYIYTKFRATKQFKDNMFVWERDESSR